MQKQKRQEKILELVRAKRISTQAELVNELRKLNIGVTQSCISRDIRKLGLVKIDGAYSTPRILKAARAPERLDIDTAGEHLIVIKLEPGQAQPVALTIDQAKIAEVVGTVAGDDTIFVAVKNLEYQRKALKKIVELFKA